MVATDLVLGRAYKKTRASVNVARIIAALISSCHCRLEGKKGRIRTRIQIVRPMESTAETQPQLQPALLRLSAMISKGLHARQLCTFTKSDRAKTLDQREPGFLGDLSQKRLMLACLFRLLRIYRILRFSEKYFGLLSKPYLRISTTTPNK